MTTRTRYYLGVKVAQMAQATAPPGWSWAMWPDGRWFLHWAEQLTAEPWAAVSARG